MTIAVLAGGTPAADLDPADVTERIYRGSGPGGQHRNKVETGVHLLHRPTGVEAKVDRGRSQWQNRQEAWRELERRLSDQRASAADAALNDHRVSQVGAGDRPSHDWTWCAWRDTATCHAAGRSWPMSKALRGRFLV